MFTKKGISNALKKSRSSPSGDTLGLEGVEVTGGSVPGVETKWVVSSGSQGRDPEVASLRGLAL